MNIAHLIQEKARLMPEKPSVMMASPLMKHYDYPFYTFKEFEERSQRIANRLTKAGVKKGERVVLFIRPCLDFSVIVFALFKMGVIPVMIDPGMGRKNLLRAIEEVKPSGLIGVNVVHILKHVFKKSFKTLKWSYSVEKNFILASELLKDLEIESLDFKSEDMSESDPAAILFTSGGTGTPKGVITTHGILVAQTKMLQEMFSLTPEDIDLPGFPLFALFTLAMGMTSIIPDMDPTRPAQCDPMKITRTLKEKKITFAAGSPAIWERVGEYCKTNNIILPDLKYVVMFGAPVSGDIHALFKDILPSGTTYTPYGATECLPVSLFDGKSVLSETWEKTKQGQGVCVGSPTPGNKILILDDSNLEVSQGIIGEIAVLGPTVTPGYFEREEATRLAKIQTPEGLIHRMGDVGYKDEHGRVWFCGRKTHVVKTSQGPLYSIQVEGYFNVHSAVKRSALISYEGEAAIVVELKKGHKFKDVKSDLEKINNSLPQKMLTILEHRSFPVDVRHNIKIDRVALSAWAKGRA